jgi:predicted  nucleic acid-binding Zn-ribbon protein
MTATNHVDEHACNQTKEFLKISLFMGEIRESVKNTRKDLKAFFDMARDTNKSIKDLHTEIEELKTALSDMEKKYDLEIKELKMKYTFIGVVAAVVVQIGLFFGKKFF